MYKVALIQNESEMMRYSWADIRPMINDLKYPFDSFTAENIEKLYPSLKDNEYDAIVIASNACNDKFVRESLQKHKGEIDEFLKKGKGIFVSSQMKLANFPSYGFFPESFEVSAVNRIRDQNEKPSIGILSIGEGQEKHSILNYPSKIELSKLTQRCLNNNLVEGIYWTYLNPENPENYNVLIKDRNSNRPLFLCSRQDFPFRIVISTIFVDWQMHSDLWENSMQYVIEGRPSIAIITKSGHSNFDFRFFISSLEINKLPYAEYEQSEITTSSVVFDVHETYVFDPAWSENEISEFVNNCSDLIDKGLIRIFYFQKKINGKITLVAVSNVREYQSVVHNSLTWLISQSPDEDKGFWSDSFWYTVDVIFTLKDFNIPVDQFSEIILNELLDHDMNGSYDEVLGATCAMLQVYYLFLSENHERTERTLKWILDNVETKTLFEKATAYHILTELGINVQPSKLTSFVNEVMTHLKDLDSYNEFEIYRYSRTLLTCGFHREAEQIVKRLINFQDKKSGKFVNVPNTAAIVELLIDIRREMKKPNSEIDTMIFKGIQYLRSTYTPEKCSWNSDISATAKSIKTLKAFETRIETPIDVLTTAIKEEYMQSENFIAIEVAMDLNTKLISKNNKLITTVNDLRAQIEEFDGQMAFASNLSMRFTIIFSTLFIISLAFFNYLFSNGLIDEVITVLKDFVSESILYLVPSVILFTSLVTMYTLNKLGKIPEWLHFIISQFIKDFDKKERDEA